MGQSLLVRRVHDDPDEIRSRPGPRKWMPRLRDKAVRRTWPLIKVLREIAERHQATPASTWLVVS
jgi:aryl-alcohol dehydrogenase-like predicted oxidoreductase